MDTTTTATTPRPVFNVNTVDRTNKSFKNLVDKYERWANDGGCEESRETYESDIIKCLNHYDMDGFQLVKYMEDTLYLEGDRDLVDILDDAFFVKDSLVRDLTKKWIDENSLTIPTEVLGKKVSAKQGFRKFTDQYITGIKLDTYQVTIHTDPNHKGGNVINYENITFID